MPSLVYARGHQGQQIVVHIRTQAVLEEWKMEATMKSGTLLMHSSKATGLYNQPKAFYWKVEKKWQIIKENKSMLKSTLKLSNNLKQVTLSV